MKDRRIIKTDIHLHTCLSPCADITQSPKRILEKASEEKFDLIFITDHNSIANVKAAMDSAAKYGDIKVYPGMEITTKEEIHILSLFENLQDAGRTHDYINNFLPDVYSVKEQNEQIIADEKDEVIGFYGKSLFSAVDIHLENIIELIHENNGIAIAAHIDRQSFSIISQLGFIPEICRLDALEISPNMSLKEAAEVYKDYSLKYKFVKGSDSHSLDTIGCAYTEFKGNDNSFKEFHAFLNE